MGAAVPLNKSKTQFSLRAIALLMAATAYWVWVLSEIQMRPADLALFAAIGVAAGIVGHVVHAYCLPWRVTALATAFVLINLFLGGLVLLERGASSSWVAVPAWLFHIAVVPARVMIHLTVAPRHNDTFYCAMIFGSAAILTAAHPIRPSLPTAIITALGIALWYGFSAVILASAG